MSLKTISRVDKAEIWAVIIQLFFIGLHFKNQSLVKSSCFAKLV